MLAEFIGTFFLVFLSCTAIVLTEIQQSNHASFIPVIFGGTVTIMIYATGHISGAHFNPAVTIAFWLNKKMQMQKVPLYIISQILGASTACLIMFLLFGSDHSFGATTTSISTSATITTEFILSFLLMFVIMSVATDSRAIGELAGIAIGLTVAMAAFVGGPLTGASMNPARSIAPAIFSQQTDALWVYMTIPIIGATLGALTYSFIRCDITPAAEDEQHGCC